ncbi:MAG: tetratricopeptide repeat protein, partial [Myxococcota bacterium]
LNEMHNSDDGLGFGNVDLPTGGSGDLLGGPRSHPGVSSGSLDLSSDDLGSTDLGRRGSGDFGAPDGFGRASRPSGAYGFQPNASGPANASGPQMGAGDQTALSEDLNFGSGDMQASADVLDAAGRDLASELEVGDIPDLPPLWQTYKQQIIGFSAGVVFVLIGVYTQFFTSVGAWGIPGLISVLTTAAPPPPPPAPPPAPPKVADPREIQSLIDEHSYESFRSVFATLQQAGGSVADNRLALAKARGFATLAYGDGVFALSAVTTAVADLNTIDMSDAMNGNAAASNIAFAKSRAALQIMGGQPDQAIEQLIGMVEARSDDKELALLLGRAYSSMDQHAKAVAAYDKALVADPSYAPALHAIGAGVEALGGSSAQSDAATWFHKAIDANPRHSRSGIEAARLYERQSKFGEMRSILRKTAAFADRGLPPDQRPAFLYKVAQLHDEQDRLQEVTKFALEAARLQPGNTTYVALGAVAAAESGDAQRGLQMIEPVLARDPNNVDALIARARVYVKLDDIAKGFIDLDKARSIAPDDARIPLREAQFNNDLGKFNDARKMLRRAVRIADDNPRPFIDQGRLELKLGNVDAAYDSAQRAVETAPDDARTHRLLAACYARRGQLNEAERSFRRAAELDSEDITSRLGYANALRDRAAKRRKPATSQALAQAIPIYVQALREQPDNPQILFEYGRALELQGDLLGALALYGDAAKLDAKDVRPHLKMVSAHLEPSNLDLKAATRSLKRARSIEVSGGLKMPEVSYWEARVALEDKRPRDAVNAMRSAIESAPTNAQYQYWLGLALEQDNSLYEAITHYEKAVKLNSRYAEAIRALGRAALERKLFDKARKYFNDYRKAAPDDHSVLLDIGDSFTIQNRDREAEAAYKKVLQKMPKNGRALLQLGNIADRRGQGRKAIAFYRKAARANPDFGEAVCKAALAQADVSVNRRVLAELTRCRDLKNSPEDLRTMAKEILVER